MTLLGVARALLLFRGAVELPPASTLFDASTAQLFLAAWCALRGSSVQARVGAPSSSLSGKTLHSRPQAVTPYFDQTAAAFVLSGLLVLNRMQATRAGRTRVSYGNQNHPNTLSAPRAAWTRCRTARRGTWPASWRSHRRCATPRSALLRASSPATPPASTTPRGGPRSTAAATRRCASRGGVDARARRITPARAREPRHAREGAAPHPFPHLPCRAVSARHCGPRCPLGARPLRWSLNAHALTPRGTLRSRRRARTRREALPARRRARAAQLQTAATPEVLRPAGAGGRARRRRRRRTPAASPVAPTAATGCRTTLVRAANAAAARLARTRVSRALTLPVRAFFAPPRHQVR